VEGDSGDGVQEETGVGVYGQGCTERWVVFISAEIEMVVRRVLVDGRILLNSNDHVLHERHVSMYPASLFSVVLRLCNGFYRHA